MSSKAYFNLTHILTKFLDQHQSFVTLYCEQCRFSDNCNVFLFGREQEEWSTMCELLHDRDDGFVVIQDIPYRMEAGRIEAQGLVEQVLDTYVMEHHPAIVILSSDTSKNIKGYVT